MPKGNDRSSAQMDSDSGWGLASQNTMNQVDYRDLSFNPTMNPVNHSATSAAGTAQHAAIVNAAFSGSGKTTLPKP